MAKNIETEEQIASSFLNVSVEEFQACQILVAKLSETLPKKTWNEIIELALGTLLYQVTTINARLDHISDRVDRRIRDGDIKNIKAEYGKLLSLIDPLLVAHEKEQDQEDVRVALQKIQHKRNTLLLAGIGLMATIGTIASSVVAVYAILRH